MFLAACDNACLGHALFLFLQEFQLLNSVAGCLLVVEDVTLAPAMTLLLYSLLTIDPYLFKT